MFYSRYRVIVFLSFSNLLIISSSHSFVVHPLGFQSLDLCMKLCSRLGASVQSAFEQPLSILQVTLPCSISISLQFHLQWNLIILSKELDQLLPPSQPPPDLTPTLNARKSTPSTVACTPTPSPHARDPDIMRKMRCRTRPPS